MMPYEVTFSDKKVWATFGRGGTLLAPEQAVYS